MGKLLGKGGYIIVAMGKAPTIGDAIECIDTWSINIAADSIETTGFGTATSVIYKAFEGGLKSATGSAGGTMDSDAPAVSTLISVLAASSISSVNMVLYMGPSHRFSVACVVTGFPVTAAVADKVTIGFDWTASSDVVYN